MGVIEIDYFNDIMIFEYNGEQWLVKYPEHGIPTGYAGIRIEFKDGKPVYVWIRRTGVAHYQNIWEQVAVLEAKKIGGWV